MVFLRDVPGDVFFGVVGSHLLLVDVLLKDVAEDIRVDLVVARERPFVQVPLVLLEEVKDPLECRCRRSGSSCRRVPRSGASGKDRRSSTALAPKVCLPQRNARRASLRIPQKTGLSENSTECPIGGGFRTSRFRLKPAFLTTAICRRRTSRRLSKPRACWAKAVLPWGWMASGAGRKSFIL